MKWDENGIAVCASLCYHFILPPVADVISAGSFYRAAIPQDILIGEPNTSKWGTPVAFLAPNRCDPLKYFVNHSVIFGESLYRGCRSILNTFSLSDITFCGTF